MIIIIIFAIGVLIQSDPLQEECVVMIKCLFTILVVVTISQVNVYVQTYQIVYIEYMQFLKILITSQESLKQ